MEFQILRDFSLYHNILSRRCTLWYEIQTSTWEIFPVIAGEYLA